MFMKRFLPEIMLLLERDQGKEPILVPLCCTIVSIIVFSSALLLPINPFIGKFVKYGTGIEAIILIFFFWFLLSRKSKWSNLLVLIAVLLLYAIPISWLWQTDTGDWGVIGGIIPVSDASIYTMDAARLIYGTSFSSVSSFRPLANGFLSVLLKMTSWNYPLSIAILGFLAAIATYKMVKEIQQIRGSLVASVSLVVVFLYSRTYVGKALTETLGITFAVIAYSWLMQGIRRNEPNRVVLGIGMLTMAMNIRAGAYFVIPTLLLWAAYVFRSKGMFSKGVLVGGICLIIISFGINSLSLHSIGAKDVIPFANFPDSFYGMAAGYKGWRFVNQIYPGATPVEKYQYTFELIKSQPSLLAKGVAKAYYDFFNPGSYNVFSFMNLHIQEGGNLYKGNPGSENIILYAPVFIIAGLGVFNCFKKRLSKWHGLILAGWIGLILSVPLVPPIDAGLRPYAATVPLVGFLLGEGFSLLFKGDKETRLTATALPELINWLAVVSVILIILVAFGPILVKNAANPMTFPIPLQCVPGQDYLLLQAIRGARIDITSENGDDKFRRPAMALSLYLDNIERQHLPDDLLTKLTELSAGQSLQYLIDIGEINENLKPIILISDFNLLTYDPIVLQTCATQISDTSMGRFYLADEIKLIE